MTLALAGCGLFERDYPELTKKQREFILEEMGHPEIDPDYIILDRQSDDAYERGIVCGSVFVEGGIGDFIFDPKYKRLEYQISIMEEIKGKDLIELLADAQFSERHSACTD